MNDAEANRNADLLAKTRQKLTAVTGEFQQGLGKVKNPAERRKLAAAYLDLMQNYLGKAQQGLTRYRSKLQMQDDAERSGEAAEPAPDAPSDDSSGGPA